MLSSYSISLYYTFLFSVSGIGNLLFQMQSYFITTLFCQQETTLQFYEHIVSM